VFILVLNIQIVFLITSYVIVSNNRAYYVLKIWYRMYIIQITAWPIIA